ncbi:Crp/Fnr family transcriptional regulator [Epilithonimonas lactis]|uniref:Cyclic nucleotide-binding protein n=1 Tax=Epilithonimonas lactis TaxID=421072 RepID=A0A085BKX7_9FLAO|nr:Crp/Fnr family transcriptional regulator [Epilithonimonas lactis]KFC18545.1 cyclic nucleotide-binding protein [Epilithonimonas lactis]KFC23122.1 cyclic nucleotide-binding protein [Epilithonimonas lactis]SEQ69428.1 cAMP-binding domain of CRP or a regulatory subunit of cAMP-dependent protein kinases [Epilithonimonas lactis]
MFDVLISHIQEKVDITTAEIELLKSFFNQKKLNKKEYLLQEGQICRDLTFVSKGILKSYILDDKGNERINLFAFEGWWISDFNSFLNEEKAYLNIDAIEESELLTISRENYEALTLKIPIMDRYFRILYQNSLVTKDQRLVISNNFTAEEKYLQLLESNPKITQKLSHSLIASYLGLSPETISRIRKKIALK